MYNFGYFNKCSWLLWRNVNFNLSVILLIHMFEKKDFHKPYLIDRWNALNCQIFSSLLKLILHWVGRKYQATAATFLFS